MDGMEAMGGMPGMGTMMVAWAALVLLVVAATVVGGVWLVRRSHASRSLATPETEPPAGILRRRYAEGEIDEDEYLRRRAGIAD